MTLTTEEAQLLFKMLTELIRLRGYDITVTDDEKSIYRKLAGAERNDQSSGS